MTFSLFFDTLKLQTKLGKIIPTCSATHFNGCCLFAGSNLISSQDEGDNGRYVDKERHRQCSDKGSSYQKMKTGLPALPVSQSWYGSFILESSPKLLCEYIINTGSSLMLFRVWGNVHYKHPNPFSPKAPFSRLLCKNTEHFEF